MLSRCKEILPILFIVGEAYGREVTSYLLGCRRPSKTLQREVRHLTSLAFRYLVILQNISLGEKDHRITIRSLYCRFTHKQNTFRT